MNAKLIFLIVVFLIISKIDYTQTTRVSLDLFGDSKAGSLLKVIAVMPLYYENGGYFYSEIPNKHFRKNKINESIKVLIKKRKNGNNSYFPKKIKCLNNK